MFERYTEKARRVIFFARYEASQFGAPAIEPEHLLLGLLREDENLAARFLPGARASIESIRKEVEGRAPLREKISASMELPLAAETKRTLAYAHEESDRLQHRHIGTEHLLLGLLREERSGASEILLERGLRLQGVRDEIARATTTDSRIDEGSEGRTDTSFWKKLKRNLRRTGLFEDKPQPIALGLEKLLTTRLSSIAGERVGLVCNQASVDHGYRHAADLLREHTEINLTTLFGAQHGIRGDVQDNMIETPHIVDETTGIPVFSLYSETREPTEEMLGEVDTIVFDMQDVGCRIYTFVYTLANCMRAARKYGKRVVVCDRPNPIGGERVAGEVLERGWESFVGLFPIPVRHGMTVCELARMFNEEFEIGCELETVTMDGWSRELYMDETDAPWVMPSPNIPTIETAIVFPGTVHVEGTMLSEGRGATRPFELIGAPYINAVEYARALENLSLPGVHFRACHFQPTFQKHAGKTCGGVQLHVTDRAQFEPVSAGLATVKVAFDLYPDEFRWKEPPYEYVYDRNPFDVICGTAKVRQAIEGGAALNELVAGWQPAIEDFARRRRRYLLY